jgi:hypothetical protein
MLLFLCSVAKLFSPSPAGRVTTCCLDRVQDLAVEGRTHFHLSPRSRDTYYVWKAGRRSIDRLRQMRRLVQRRACPAMFPCLTCRVCFICPPIPGRSSRCIRDGNGPILPIHEFSGGLPSLVTLSAPSSWITSRSPSSTGLFPAPLVCPFLEVCMCMHVAVLASWIATNLVPVKMREDSYSIPLLGETLESAHRNHF